MANRYSIADARSQLPRLVRKAETGHDIELTRRGKPVAVLVGQRNYERLAAGGRSFWDAYRAFQATHHPADLAIDPDVVFGDTRDTSSGRSVTL